MGEEDTAVGVHVGPGVLSLALLGQHLHKRDRLRNLTSEKAMSKSRKTVEPEKRQTFGATSYKAETSLNMGSSGRCLRAKLRWHV